MSGILIINWAAKRAIECRNVFCALPGDGLFPLCWPFLSSYELAHRIIKFPPI
jgi:hypothetical protein